jgi:hypothetical protein
MMSQILFPLAVKSLQPESQKCRDKKLALPAKSCHSGLWTGSGLMISKISIFSLREKDLVRVEEIASLDMDRCPCDRCPCDRCPCDRCPCDRCPCDRCPCDRCPHHFQTPLVFMNLKEAYNLPVQESYKSESTPVIYHRHHPCKEKIPGRPHPEGYRLIPKGLLRVAGGLAGW